MFDPPIGDGANLFIWIAMILAAFGAAIGLVDQLREKDKKVDVKREEKLK